MHRTQLSLAWRQLAGLCRRSLVWAMCAGSACDAGGDRESDPSTTFDTTSGALATFDESQALVLPDAWQLDPMSRDPLAAHRLATVACSAAAVHVEFETLEVSTQACNYASLSQPLRGAIFAGDRLRLQLWWLQLAASAPAQAHLAVLVDGQMLWQETVAIPGPADVRDLELIAPFAAPLGATVTFHLHNHGYNSWRFYALDRL